MFVTSSAIQNGAFEDKYGKRGTQFSPNGMPTYSIPFEIHDAPQGTQSFAVVLEDKDAITASGFVWIHWLIADLERTVVQENESQTATDYVQGANTWASKLGQFDIEEASFYGGWHHQTACIVTSLLCMRSIPNLTLNQDSVSMIYILRCKGIF